MILKIPLLYNNLLKQFYWIFLFFFMVLTSCKNDQAQMSFVNQAYSIPNNFTETLLCYTNMTVCDVAYLNITVQQSSGSGPPKVRQSETDRQRVRPSFYSVYHQISLIVCDSLTVERESTIINMLPSTEICIHTLSHSTLHLVVSIIASN